MYDFKEDNENGLLNVIEILIKHIDIHMNPQITEKCNLFEIDGNEFALESGSYTLDEIIEMFNEQLESEKCDIKISTKGEKIFIEHTKGSEFEIDCSNNSMGKFLGFTQSKYTKSSSYLSELNHAFITKPIYLYIKNIENDKPFAIISPDGSFEQKISKFDTPISELACLIIQFRNKVTNNKSDLVNFGDVVNSVTFSIKTQ